MENSNKLKFSIELTVSSIGSMVSSSKLKLTIEPTATNSTEDSSKLKSSVESII